MIFYLFFYSDKAVKKFTPPFEETVKNLYSAGLSRKKEIQLRAFKNFVNEFGTHYAAITELGTKLTIERRYSAKERASATTGEMAECNTLVGSKIFGFQTEMARHNCTKEQLMDKSDDSVRTIIVSYDIFAPRLKFWYIGQNYHLHLWQLYSRKVQKIAWWF